MIPHKNCIQLQLVYIWYQFTWRWLVGIGKLDSGDPLCMTFPLTRMSVGMAEKYLHGYFSTFIFKYVLLQMVESSHQSERTRSEQETIIVLAMKSQSFPDRFIFVWMMWARCFTAETNSLKTTALQLWKCSPFQSVHTLPVCSSLDQVRFESSQLTIFHISNVQGYAWWAWKRNNYFKFCKKRLPAV